MSRRDSSVNVLFGPPFATFEPSVAANRSLIRALRAHGARVTTLWCDQAQSRECAVYGGVWGGGTEFEKNCLSCARAAETESGLGDRAVRVTDVLSSFPDSTFREVAISLSQDELADLEVDGYPIGQAARQIMSNMWTTETWRDIPDADSLLRTHVANLLRLNLSYRTLLDSGDFNRVISNDSSYGMWGLLHHQAALRQIPAYSLWPVTGSRVATGDVQPAMQPDYREPWDAFRNHEMAQVERAAVERFLEVACGGRGGRISSETDLSEPTFAFSGNTIQESVVVIAANVVWDLASYEKQRVFSDFASLVRATIEWFSTNPGDVRLVVRSHPVESDPALPRTRMTLRDIVERALSDMDLKDPDWFVFDDGSVPLEHWLRPGVTFVVNTSTTGAVAAARGAAVIATGDAPYIGLGIAHEPRVGADYFRMLSAAVAGTLPTSDPELAKKYLLLQNFVYYSDWEEYRRIDWLKVAPNKSWRPKKRSKALDYVVRQILRGERIMSSQFLPPVTLPY